MTSVTDLFAGATAPTLSPARCCSWERSVRIGAIVQTEAAEFSLGCAAFNADAQGSKQSRVHSAKNVVFLVAVVHGCRRIFIDGSGAIRVVAMAPSALAAKTRRACVPC